MTVRRATPADRDAVVRMALAAWPEAFPDDVADADRAGATFDEAMADPAETILLVEADGKVVGMSLLRLVDFGLVCRQALVQRAIFVWPDFRGARATAELIDALLLMADGLSVEILVELGEARNAAIARMMRRHGFRPSSITLRRPTNGVHHQAGEDRQTDRRGAATG